MVVPTEARQYNLRVFTINIIPNMNNIVHTAVHELSLISSVVYTMCTYCRVYYRA